MREFEQLQEGGELFGAGAFIRTLLEFWDAHPHTADDELLNYLLDTHQWGLATRFIVETDRSAPEILEKENPQWNEDEYAAKLFDSAIDLIELRAEKEFNEEGVYEHVDPDIVSDLNRRKQPDMLARYILDNVRSQALLPKVVVEKAKRVNEKGYREFETRYEIKRRAERLADSVLDGFLEHQDYEMAAKYMLDQLKLEELPEPIRKAAKKVSEQEFKRRMEVEAPEQPEVQ